MTDKPLISVVIPTYRRPEGLARAVKSVLDQTHRNIEVLVVNDNPTESEFFAIASEVSHSLGDDPRVRVLGDGTNRGGSGARNVGIANARGEYVSFLDDDDVYFPEKLEVQLEHLIEADIDVSVCDMEMYRDGVRVFDKKSAAKVGSIAEFIIEGNAYTPMIFCKRDVLSQVGMFHDTPRFQDHVLMIKILESGFSVEELHVPLFIHNDHLGERIKSSKESALGYRIRHEFEARNAHRLSKRQRRYFNLKVALRNARILHAEKRWGGVVGQIARAYVNVSNVREIKAVTRRVRSLILDGADALPGNRGSAR